MIVHIDMICGMDIYIALSGSGAWPLVWNKWPFAHVQSMNMLWYIIYMYVQVHVHVVHAYMYTTRNLTSSIGLARVHVQ